MGNYSIIYLPVKLNNAVLFEGASPVRFSGRLLRFQRGFETEVSKGVIKDSEKRGPSKGLGRVQ